MKVMQCTDDNFGQLISENENVVIRFSAPWCVTCEMLARQFKSMACDRQYKQVLFAEVNVEEQKELTETIGLEKVPFFATFKKGKMMEAKATAMREKIVAMVQKLMMN